MERIVCYCMTRNLYNDFKAAYRSLVVNGGPIDHVYVLAEDDDLGYPLPENFTVINVSNQKFFRPDGPNYGQHWSWMVLMRVALCKVLPKTISRVLSLDIDTIVRQDLSGLWKIDLGDNYFAGVRENTFLSQKYPYINGGVVLWNLRQMRDGMADKMIERLNTLYYKFNEQDVMNKLCRDKRIFLPSDYNASAVTFPTDNVIIKHYAARHVEHMRSEEYKMFMSMEGV